MYIFGVNGNVALFKVRSGYHLDSVQRITPILEKCLLDVIGYAYTVKYTIADDKDEDIRFDVAVDTICLAYDISREDLMSERRTKQLVGARRELCQKMVATGRFNPQELGRRLNRDHSTIINLLKEK